MLRNKESLTARFYDESVALFQVLHITMEEQASANWPTEPQSPLPAKGISNPKTQLLFDSERITPGVWLWVGRILGTKWNDNIVFRAVLNKAAALPGIYINFNFLLAWKIILGISGNWLRSGNSKRLSNSRRWIHNREALPLPFNTICFK